MVEFSFPSSSSPASSSPSPILGYSLLLDLVTDFYRVSTNDVFIGYLFATIDDFPTHLPRIANFWFAQINGQFHHQEPVPFDLIKIHQPLMFKKAHVRRWVILFHQAMEKKQQQDESLHHHPGWQKLKEKIDSFEKIFLQNRQLFS